MAEPQWMHAFLTGWMHSRGEGVGEKTESDGCLKGEYKGTDVDLKKNGKTHFYVC